MGGQLFLLWMRHKMLLCDPDPGCVFRGIYFPNAQAAIVHSGCGALHRSLSSTSACVALSANNTFFPHDKHDLRRAGTSIVPSLRTCVLKIIKIK